MVVVGGASKIVDEQEVLRWFEEGRTYNWMAAEYLRKYNIETVPSMWGNFRRRRGLARRIARDDSLIPWAVNLEHRQMYPLAMLRLESRLRDNFELREVDRSRLDGWKDALVANKAVVHYDSETEQGFFYVPRESGDAGLIREPKVKTTTRLRVD